MSAPRTGLVVLVPEAEAAVADLRLELDPHARLGVPAHVTVLHPFVAAGEVTPDLLARLTTLFAAVPAFEATFTRTAWFGEEVLWLAPEPDGPFRALTDLAVAAFPDHPPYEGRFDVVVPHLSVAVQAAPEIMRAAEATVAAALPFDAVVRDVALVVESDSGTWSVATRFRLAPARTVPDSS